MSWTWGASSSFTEFTFPRRVCFSPRSPGGVRGIKRFGEVAESTPNGHGRFIPWAPLAHAVDTDEMLHAAVDFLHLWREQAPSKVPRTWGTIYMDERFPLVHEANLDGTAAGTVSVWPRGIFAWIDNVATHPDFRMRGVGRTMLFEACKRAIEARCEWTLLISDLFDTPKEMYKTLGFEAIGEVRGFLRE